ncbi:hypothetical protein MMC34_006612 [Xylographa carneopallida]|nr:hypothetical protein [Xylographa carneopallida]
MAPQSWNQKYTDSYGLPPGRPVEIPSTNLEGKFYRKKAIDGGSNKIGGLNLGIYLVRRKTDGRTYVQKKIDGTEKYLRREIHVLHRLKHPNIIEYLFQRSRSTAVKIPEAFIWHVFQSLTSALQYIHHGIKPSDPSPIQTNKGSGLPLAERLRKKWPTILHRDIKLADILLCRTWPFIREVQKPLPFPLCFTSTTNTHYSQPFPRVVLADFGAACQQGDQDWDDKDDTFTGTLSWMPPELPAWSERGDVWSLGAVILLLCNLLPRGPLQLPPAGPPWKRTLDIDIGKEYSSYLGDTIWHCLRPKAEDRPFSFRLMAFVVEGQRLAALEGKLRVRELPEWALSPRSLGNQPYVLDAHTTSILVFNVQLNLPQIAHNYELAMAVFLSDKPASDHGMIFPNRLTAKLTGHGGTTPSSPSLLSPHKITNPPPNQAPSTASPSPPAPVNTYAPPSTPLLNPSHPLTDHSPQVLTGSADRTIRLYNPLKAAPSTLPPTSTPTPTSRLPPSSPPGLIQTYSAHGYEVLDLAVSADNARFASVGGDRQVFLWDVATGRTLRRWAGHAGRVNAVALGGPAQEVVVSGSFDATVRVWDAKSAAAKPVMVWEDAGDSVSCVEVQGWVVVAGSVDGRVRTYDVRMGVVGTDVLGCEGLFLVAVCTLLRKMVSNGVADPVTSVSLTADGAAMLVSTLDSTLRLMDRTNGQLLQAYRGHANTEYRVRSCLGLNDAVVVSGSEDGCLYAWDVLEGKVVEQLRAHEGKVASAVAWNGRAREWASAGGDGEDGVCLGDAVMHALGFRPGPWWAFVTSMKKIPEVIADSQMLGTLERETSTSCQGIR